MSVDQVGSTPCTPELLALADTPPYLHRLILLSMQFFNFADPHLATLRLAGHINDYRNNLFWKASTDDITDLLDNT